MVLATAAQADADFFPALAALARRAEELSEPLQMMLLAIEVTNEVLPDERPAAVPLAVTELRLRLRTNGRAILLRPAANVPARSRNCSHQILHRAGRFATAGDASDGQ